MFYLLFVLLAYSCRYLDVSLFEKIQDCKVQDFEQQQVEVRQVTLDHVGPICFLSLVYTLACLH
jgi:hypothetical protein